ncbi:hypothetical protein OG604_49275 [Streptomyces sp. NBC_01231]|nr:hypothetical protein OG604_49275 [Streptomyces sp. NBC_01231]
MRAILIGDEKWRPSLVETSKPEKPGALPRKDYPKLWRDSEIWVWDSQNDSVVPHPPGTL